VRKSRTDLGIKV